MRYYRTAKGFWGFGVSRGSGHWSIQFGPWVLTTWPGDD